MITSLTHIAINVSDMDASVNFYCNALGCTEAFNISDDKGNPWIKYIKVGSSQFIELFYGRKGDENIHPSFQHLCLEVDDMESTIKQIESSGVKIDSYPSTGKDHNTQAWIKDPDGNRIELMQLSKQSPQYKAINNN